MQQHSILLRVLNKTVYLSSESHGELDKPNFPKPNYTSKIIE